MAVFTLESLVLRGSSVVINDVQAVNPRRGTSYTARMQTPEMSISMLMPSFGSWRDIQPDDQQLDTDVAQRHAGAAAAGVGRSRCRTNPHDNVTSRNFDSARVGETPLGTCLRPITTLAGLGEQSSTRLFPTSSKGLDAKPGLTGSLLSSKRSAVWEKPAAVSRGNG